MAQYQTNTFIVLIIDERIYQSLNLYKRKCQKEKSSLRSLKDYMFTIIQCTHFPVNFSFFSSIARSLQSLQSHYNYFWQQLQLFPKFVYHQSSHLISPSSLNSIYQQIQTTQYIISHSHQLSKYKGRNNQLQLQHINIADTLFEMDIFIYKNFFVLLLSTSSRMYDEIYNQYIIVYILIMSSQSEKILNVLLNKKNDYIITKKEDYINYIILNRPKKGNSLSEDMYLKIEKSIIEANKDEKIKFIVMLGNGNNFCTGRDLNTFQDPDLQQFETEDVLNFAFNSLESYGRTLIQSKKPIFGLVQGRITGIAFLQVVLFEKIFAAQNSLFKADFVQMGQVSELGSTYIFPKKFGMSLTQEIFMIGKELTAKEVNVNNFLDISPTYQQAQQNLIKYLAELNSLEWKSYMDCRALIYEQQKRQTLIAHKKEIEILKKQIKSKLTPQHAEFMFRYLQKQKQKRSKL